MTDAYIQVPVDGGGKKVATQEVTRATVDAVTNVMNVVEQQEFVLAKVDDGQILSLLQQIIVEIRDLKYSLLNALN